MGAPTRPPREPIPPRRRGSRLISRERGRAAPVVTSARMRPMKYRKLGDSDLEVSEISLGSWLTYGVGVEADKARACLEEAFAQGINFIDTANVYGRGAAETFLGEALQGHIREDYILATKAYFPMSDSDRGLSRAQIEKQ